MCILLFDVFKHLLLRKTDVLKTCQKSRRNALALKSKKEEGIFGENLYFSITILSCCSSTKSCLRFPLNCFVRDIKGFYLSSLGNEVNFRDIMNVFPNILAKNSNFRKLRQGFVDDRARITTKLIYSCHWKPL